MTKSGEFLKAKKAIGGYKKAKRLKTIGWIGVATFVATGVALNLIYNANIIHAVKKCSGCVCNSTFLSKFAGNRFAYAGLSAGLYNILRWQPCRPTQDECKQSVQNVALVGYIGWIYSAVL